MSVRVKKKKNSLGVDENGRTPLHQAVERGDYSKAKTLLKKSANPMDIDNKGCNALHIAAENAHFKILQLLLTRKGININCLTSNQESLYSLLAKHEGFDVQSVLHCLQTLFDMGANPHQADFALFSPLHYACHCGSVETVKFFLEVAKVNPNTPNCVGDTPLHLAVQKGRLDIVSELLNNGDSASTRNHRGHYPSDVATQLNYVSLASRLRAHIKKSQLETSWRRFSTSPPLPPRFHHSATVIDGNLIIIGGCDHSDLATATHFYSSVIVMSIGNSTWTETEIVPQLGLAGHSASKVGNILFISGGWHSVDQENHSMFSLDTETFEFKELGILSDTPHRNHQSVCISRLNVLFFACKPTADDIKKHFNMIHLYDIKTDGFLKLPTMNGSISPCYRENYSAAKIEDKVYLFGGIAGTDLFDDIWIYDAKANSWSLMFPSGHRPSARHTHGMAVRGTDILIFGGIDSNGSPLQDFYKLDIKEAKWVNFNFGSQKPPPPRIGTYSLFSDENDGIYACCGSNERTMIEIGAHCKPASPPPVKPRLKIPPVPPPRRPVATRSGSHDLPSSDVKEKEEKIASPIIKTPAPAPIPVKPHKKKIIELLESVIELEEYSDTLCQDALHLIAVLDPLSRNGKDIPHIPEGVNPLELLSGLCQDLGQFLEEQKPQSLSLHTEGKPESIWKPRLLLSGKHMLAGKTYSMPSSAMQWEKEKTLTAAQHPGFVYFQDLGLPFDFIPREKPSDFATLPKPLQQRHFIANEILTTETDYVKALGMIVAMYMKPLQNDFDNVIIQYDFNSIFKNTEALLEFNSELLAELNLEIDKDKENQDFGGVFLRKMPDFHSYLVYCANQSTANETLSRLDKESSEFQQFMDVTFAIPLCQGQTLESLIIKPFQRICRYPLLLKELKKNTPTTWSTYDNIVEAIDQINIVVKQANESKKQTDSLVQIMGIQNQFILGPGDVDLMNMHKWHFVKEGVLRLMEKKKVSSKQWHVFLFAETIILTHKKAKRYQRVHSFDTKTLLIYDTENHEKFFPFSIVNITNNMKLDVACLSLDDKSDWITKINQCGSVE